MQYKFPYIDGYPMIMAKLRKENCKARYFEFLIDSGADFTMISKSYAAVLGLEYAKIKNTEIKVEVANLTFIQAKRTTLILTIEGNDLAIPVLIANEDVECLLGRKGFFENFDILFQENQQQVIFKKV